MESQEYDAMAQVEDTHWWYAGMRRITAALLAHTPPAHVQLDAGCGTGGNLRHPHATTNRHGFDSSSTALRHAASHGSSVLQADIQAIPIRTAAIDLVTSFDVLYHRAVTDDAAALRELARVTAPGGFVLLRLPAHEWLRGSHDDHVHTQRRYAAADVRVLCASAGLVVRRLTYVNTLLLPVVLVTRIWHSQTRDNSSALHPPSAFEQRIGCAALGLEAFLLRIGITFPYGVSLMCLAQRPARPTETE